MGNAKEKCKVSKRGSAITLAHSSASKEQKKKKNNPNARAGVVDFKAMAFVGLDEQLCVRVPQLDKPVLATCQAVLPIHWFQRNIMNSKLFEGERGRERSRERG